MSPSDQAQPRHSSTQELALAYLAIFGGMLCVAVGTSFAKSLFPTIGAEGTVAYRVGFAAILLLLLWRPWRFKYRRADLQSIILYGGAVGAMNLCFYLSLRTLPLGPAIAIGFMGPLVLALITSRGLADILWVGLAIGGLGLLLPLSGSARLDLLGIGLAASAGLFWALYIVFGQRVSHVHPGHTVALGMTVAACVVMPFGIYHAGSSLLSPPIAVAALVVAIASSALPYSLEMYALRHIPKRTFGVVLSLEPAIGAAAGLLVLHETLTGQQWLAISAIVIASAGAIYTSSGQTAPDETTLSA